MFLSLALLPFHSPQTSSSLPSLSIPTRWNFKHAAELRHYAPYIVAEVSFPSDMPMRQVLNLGFRAVANYIFGNNIAQDKISMTSPVVLEQQQPSSSPTASSRPLPNEKISMTSPVTMEQQSNKSTTVSFIMPSKYTSIDDLPKPVNDQVILKQVPARIMAALTWNGGMVSEERKSDKVDALLDIMSEEGLRAVNTGNQHLWQYHPPFAPSYMRVNEVLLEVEDDRFIENTMILKASPNKNKNSLASPMK